MPKHPKTATKGCQGLGGPLKRTGDKACDWDSLIGPSLDSVPATQLPTVNTVLQRYRALRIEKPNESKASLATRIAGEVKDIWDRARVPTVAERNCVRKILEKN